MCCSEKGATQSSSCTLGVARKKRPGAAVQDKGSRAETYLGIHLVVMGGYTWLLFLIKNQ